MKRFLALAAFCFSSFLSGYSLAEIQISVTGLFKNAAVVNIAGQQRMLKLGKPSPEGVTLISATSRVAVLEIDGQQKEYPLGEEISSGFSKPDKLPSVTIALDARKQFKVGGSANGYPVVFLVDTGATGVSLTAATAKSMGLDFRYLGKPSYSITANGKAPIYLITLDTVKVGEIVVRNVSAAVHESTGLTVNLLGMSFLKEVEMTNNGTSLVLKQKFR